MRRGEYYRQIKADIAANGLETALKRSTRKVTLARCVNRGGFAAEYDIIRTL